MYAEADLVPLSALQHFVVCPRQCALIHLEQVWLENARTAEGRAAHEKVDEGGHEQRGGLRRSFGTPLRSLALGLAGRADVVEFHADPTGGPERPFPVEHKRGKPKAGDEDRVQLCAQALCLEEMNGRPVPEGALFYGQRKRRTGVVFDEPLRRRVEAVALAVHGLFRDGLTPPPRASAPCAGCSLHPACRPDVFGDNKTPVAGWVASRLADNAEPEDFP